MATRLDEIAELLLKALAAQVSPDQVGFVYVHRGGDLNGVEELVEQSTRELADAEAQRLASRGGGELVFVREQRPARTSKQTAESPLLTREEAAAYLRIGVRTLARQNIEPLRIGGRVFYTQEILDAWLDTKRPRSTSAQKTVAPSSTSAPPKVAAPKSPSVSRTTLNARMLKTAEELSRPRRVRGPATRTEIEEQRDGAPDEVHGADRRTKPATTEPRGRKR